MLHKRSIRVISACPNRTV